MTNVPKSEPLFKSVDELHAALRKYASEALETTTREMPLHMESADEAKRFVLLFELNVKERMAQISSALWMERERDEEEKILVDGKALSSVEEVIYGIRFAVISPLGGGAAGVADAITSIRHFRGSR